MGQTGVGQVERGIQFLGGHRGIGGIDHDSLPAHGLQQPVGVHHVGFLLDVSEIFCLRLFVLQTFLVAMQHYVGVGYASWYII